MMTQSWNRFRIDLPNNIRFYIVENSEYLKAIYLLKQLNYQVIESRCRAFISIANNEIKLNYFESDFPEIFLNQACHIGDGYLIFAKKLLNEIKFLLDYNFSSSTTTNILSWVKSSRATN